MSSSSNHLDAFLKRMYDITPPHTRDHFALNKSHAYIIISNIMSTPNLQS